MVALSGIGIGTGIAVGPIRRMSPPLPAPPDSPSKNEPLDELRRAKVALNAVMSWLSDRARELTGEAATVLEAQALMANDLAVADDVEARIMAGATAERAVFDAYAKFQVMLANMGGYMAERAADVADVSQRVVAHIAGVEPPGIPHAEEPFILVAHDLSPADTALLDATKVLGFITREGGPTSHTAILARSLSIPAVVGTVGADGLSDHTTVILDASSSRVIIEPSDSEIETALVRREAWLDAAMAPITRGALGDGHPLPLMANVGGAPEVTTALALGAEGVGLFRTEFLFLDSKSAPSVEGQRAHYEDVFSACQGERIVVRVLDAGSDKHLPFLNDALEENPALGLRGIRALRKHEDVLRDQLRAIVLAEESTGAEAWVMAPMVADVDEATYFVDFAKNHGVRVAGVMAEVPSLALVADQVFDVVDFVSIGTNDLTAYTMAADRMLGSVATLQDPWHPAVLRLIERLCRAGEATGKPVGVCGEAAADPNLAIVLAGLGVTSLSMTPAALADVRAALLTVSLDEAQRRATRAVTARSAAHAREIATS